MAECSYARCLQERRLIKRELLKWSKNMVYIVGLERVAEELMGRRKWKLYQEVLARSQSNANPSNVVQLEKPSQNSKIVLQQQQEKENLATQHQALLENHLKGKEIYTVKNEISENLQDRGYFPTNISEKGPKDNSTSITSEHSENPVTPIDWKPDEKCYFCIDGNLLTVNEKGDLVAESGPALSEAELANRTSIDSDSDSSDSSPDLEIHRQPSANVSKTLTSRLRDSLPPKMTSLESMAAHLAAVASIQGIPSGLGPFCPSIWYHQLAQHVSSATPPAAEAPAPISPSIKDSPSPSDATGEQPLDLSSKPSPNSSMSASSDPKQVFRAKPRMSAVTGRRTYTEEELHSALQDIISGKLGTRRAAVLYGIPRSTLRNKVYKIAMEQKREANILHPPVLEDLVDPDDEDKELSGDDERDDKILSRSLVSQPEDLARFATSQMAAAALQKIGKTQDNIETDIKPSTSLDAQMKLPQTTPQSQTPPNPWLDPNVLLQSLLLSLGGIPGLMQPKVEDQATVRELFSNLMIQQDEMRKEQMKSSTVTTAATSDTMNNGKPNLIDPRLLMQNLPLLQQQQQQQQQHPQQHQHPAYMYQSRLPKSEASETGSSVDMIEGSDDPSVILKIPSYKPVAGSSSGKNGEHMNSPAPSATPLLSRSPQQPNNIPGISPPLIRQSSESQSPPIFSLRDVIANSISRTFNQQAKEANVMKTTPSAESNDPHKRASISVIKNLGGTDISRFATQPNLLSNNASNSSQNASSSSGGVGGKGTRPKRGKYRNYDRDSLVEAVKAVQRGEMSVHRAGSYYGVPHSTLEYKVKERHLMRPRKREPKPQPLDDRTGGGSSSGSTSSKNTNIPGIAAVSSLDKMKPSLAAQKPALKNNPPFPSTSPNGMKVPIFDPAMAAQLQYTQQFFWPHSTGFGGLPMDFPRTPGAAGPPQFPPNAENFLASQMIQRFHEESSRITASNNISSSNTALPSPSTNNKFAPNNTNPASKSTRELAESLYDSGGANGSFLDGIIRKTLDRKTSDIPHGALIDQLVKNTRTPVVGSSNTEQISNTKTKRPASPVHYPVIDIKRERSSPTTLASLEAERSSIETNISKESVECLTKKRDDFLLQMEDQQQLHHQVHHPSMHRQQSHHQSGSGIRPLLVEDLNGGSSSIHEQLGKIKSENEDNL